MIGYRTFTYLIMALLIVVSTIGCQKTVYLMPTPSVMASGEHNPFDRNPNLEKSNQIAVLYATNRSPLGEDEFTNYSIFPGNKLYLGIAHLEIGSKNTDWNQIFKISTSDDKNSRPALYLERLEELAAIPLDSDTELMTEKIEALSDALNKHLSKSLDKDIMVYVHGANSTIYRAAAQAAQYRHFTGQNSTVMVFLWPSAENLLAYGTDVRHARRSAPAFKRLISFLSKYTTAEKINILAYSAGAQIASPGLAILGKETHGEKRNQLRLGEVYFAAPDIGTDTFVEHLKSYIDIPRSVTLTINMKDSVLALARRHHGISRIGSPDKKDMNEEDKKWGQNATWGSGLYVIGVDDKTVKGMSAGAHDFWYSHPWISSDILIQFLFHADPPERGLTENFSDQGLRYWTFPEDYPDRITSILRETKKEMQAQ
ncbi:MAG: alpha/beta hydrolase [Desulfobacteraceae bacterium]|nr:alpha/beta hydrolase [Desulfobacteraceae bacterium]MBC2754093.1 alpha/beta hydrolase [Desulfobacteraceae bacterium]